MNIRDLSSCNLIGLSSSLAIMIGENLSSEDLAILSSFFSAFADNLAIISAKKAVEENTTTNNNNS